MITIHIENKIAILTLNRPERRNALCREMMEMISMRLADLNSNSEVLALIITGSTAAFCSGSDLYALASLDLKGISEHEAYTAQVVRELTQFSKPVLMAVEGFALGGGFAFALAGDIIVSAENARWHFPEIINGWVPPWGLTPLRRRLSPALFTRCVWGEAPMTANEAHRLGIVDHLSPRGEALVMALKIAEKMIALPPNVVSQWKSFSKTSLQLHEEEDAQLNSLFTQQCQSPRAQETFLKFKNKLNEKKKI